MSEKLGIIPETEPEEEEEYILLDLDNLPTEIKISHGIPYSISALNTLNPIFAVGEKAKMVGVYEETIGTCYVFSESAKAAEVGEDFSSESNTDSSANENLKKVSHVATVNKILKFSFRKM